jgi:hypothetical protein
MSGVAAVAPVAFDRLDCFRSCRIDIADYHLGAAFRKEQLPSRDQSLDSRL